MSLKEKIKVKVAEHGKRLDVFLSDRLGITRSQIKKMFDHSFVFVNNEIPNKAGYAVQRGDIVEIREVIDPKSSIATKETGVDFDVEVIEENKDFIVINKPSGILVHPTMAGEGNTLKDWAVEKYPDIASVGESVVRPGIVHRLDREASGLMVIARTQKMFEHIKKQFKDRVVDKEYKVLVYGQIDSEHEVVNFDIDRNKKDGRMVSRPKIDKMKLKNVGKDQPGRNALSEFWVEEKYIRFTLLRVKIHTGRTHQIRVHMFAFGHPVFGDHLYLNKKLIKKSDHKLGRLFLHAEKLCFTDLAGEKRCFHAGLPKKLENHLKNLK